jgi:hypothetical protein
VVWGHRALVLAVLLLTANHAAAQTPSAGESDASTPPQVCAEIDRFAKDYRKAFATTIGSPGSDLQKCKAANAYSGAVSKLIMSLQNNHQSCGEQKWLAEELMQDRTKAQRTRDRICTEAGVAPPPAMSPPTCMKELAARRDEMERKGMAAKAAGLRLVSRDEMCKYMTAYTAAKAQWIRFIEDNAQTCAIPGRHWTLDDTEQIRSRVCAGVLAPEDVRLHFLKGAYDDRLLRRRLPMNK